MEGGVCLRGGCRDRMRGVSTRVWRLGCAGLPLGHAWPSAPGGLFGATLAWLWPGLQRALIGREALERRAEARAAEAFLAEEVFATRARNGILIFMALFEHEVVILADEGIHHAAPAGTWQSVADDVADKMRAGHPRDAVLNAIAQCGELLHTYAGVRPEDDVNELSDRPRFSRE